MALTSFVGRAAERAALADALSEYRLVTAVGPGGVGKTRLALAVADDVGGRYSGGARYVDLVPVTDPAMVGAAVASALGFGEQPGRSPLDTVTAKLAEAEVLLVAGQLRAPARRGQRRGRTAAGRLSARGRAGHQPGPTAGAVRVRVPGAGNVSRAATRWRPCSAIARR